MDVSNAIVAKSDQINAIDLLSGPQTVTITEVKPGSSEQPVVIVTDLFGAGRPFKPSKTALRVIVASWGAESSVWVGRRMTIYRDETVRWAGEAVGGIRISALSHIDKPLQFNLAISKGKTAKTTVQPLPDAPTPVDHVAALTNAADMPALVAAWDVAQKAGATTNPAVIAAKDARKAELS